jgi:hypothetical protein
VEEFSLYGGKVTLFYEPGKHKYTAVEEDGQRIKAPSITTVLQIVNKPALVQWAVNCAIDHLRSRLYDGGEFSPEDFELFLDEAKYAHKYVMREAADIGTAAHEWLESYWKAKMQGLGELIPPMPEQTEVRNCCEAAIKWIEENDIKPLIIEKPLYSRVYKVAGRMDKLAIVNGRLAVVDWKSSTGLWPEYMLQTAAYASIYMEEFPDQRIEDRWLVKLGKYDGEFTAVLLKRPELEQDWQAFCAAITLDRRIKQLSRKAA